MTSDELAWEIAPLRPARPPRAWVPRMGAALRGGFRAGFLPGVLVMLVYYAAHHDLDMPWMKIASLLAVYAPIVGMMFAVAIEGMVLLLPNTALMMFGSALAVGVAGIAPGAFGVVVFGAYRGPFIGTALIAVSTIAGAFLVAMPAAMRARRARRGGAKPGDLRAVIVATALSTIILAACATVIAPLIVDTAFVRVQGALDEHGISVGGAVGALGGSILGLYVGLVIALARGRVKR